MVGSQDNCIITVMNMSTCAINAGECSAESIVIRRLFLPEGSPEGNNTGDLLQGGHGHARNGYVSWSLIMNCPSALLPVCFLLDSYSCLINGLHGETWCLSG